MTYTRVHADWQDDPSTATPILAVDLEHMEDGIVEGARAASETLTGNVELATTAEMNTGTDDTRVTTVKKVVDYVATALSTLPALANASETVAGKIELASTTEMNTGTDATRVPAVSKVAAYVTAAVNTLSASLTTSINALSASITSALAGKADKSGSWQVFADVSDEPYAGDEVPSFDDELDVLRPTDLTGRFAPVDSTLRLDPSAFPQFYIPTIVIPEGDVPPGVFPDYGLVGKLPAAASYLATLLDDNSVRAANNVVLTFPEAVASGEYVGFSVGFDNSTPFDHITGAFGGTGPGAGTFDFGTLSLPNATAGTLNGFVKLTSGASAGSTITFTARDAANAAINRVHLLAAMYRMPNLVATSARDQQAVGGGASSSTLTAVGASITTNTSQPDESGIGSAVISAGTSPNLRDIAGTNGWATISNILSDNGSSGRRLLVAQRVLTAIGQPSFTTQVTLSGTATQTGAWAAKIDTFKGI